MPLKEKPLSNYFRVEGSPVILERSIPNTNTSLKIIVPSNLATHQTVIEGPDGQTKYLFLQYAYGSGIPLNQTPIYLKHQENMSLEEMMSKQTRSLWIDITKDSCIIIGTYSKKDQFKINGRVVTKKLENHDCPAKINKLLKYATVSNGSRSLRVPDDVNFITVEFPKVDLDTTFVADIPAEINIFTLSKSS